MRPPSLPAVPRWAVAAVLLAAGVALAPGRAAAECGDYVTIAGQPPHADHPSPSPADPDFLPVVPRKPCHGPNCSSKPTTPALPLTAPSVHRDGSEQWAAGVLAALTDAADSQALPPLTSDAGTVRRPALLLDPPRV